MNAHAASSAPDFNTPRGGAPVGMLSELPPIEQLAILYLRAWCAGGPARARVAEDFCCLLGAATGPETVERFDALMRLMMAGARRPLMRHSTDCRCFGGDESAFANLVAAAAGRDRDEAMLFASLLMGGHAAFEVVGLAEELGGPFLAMARAAMQAARAGQGAPAGVTRH